MDAIGETLLAESQTIQRSVVPGYVARWRQVSHRSPRSFLARRYVALYMPLAALVQRPLESNWKIRTCIFHCRDRMTDRVEFYRSSWDIRTNGCYLYLQVKLVT